MAVLMLLYLGLRNISQRWTMPIQNWGSTLSQFAILFEGKCRWAAQRPINRVSDLPFTQKG